LEQIVLVKGIFPTLAQALAFGMLSCREPNAIPLKFIVQYDLKKTATSPNFTHVTQATVVKIRRYLKKTCEVIVKAARKKFRETKKRAFEYSANGAKTLAELRTRFIGADGADPWSNRLPSERPGLNDYLHTLPEESTAHLRAHIDLKTLFEAHGLEDADRSVSYATNLQLIIGSWDREMSEEVEKDDGRFGHLFRAANLIERPLTSPAPKQGLLSFPAHEAWQSLHNLGLSQRGLSTPIQSKGGGGSTTDKPSKSAKNPNGSPQNANKSNPCYNFWAKLLPSDHPMAGQKPCSSTPCRFGHKNRPAMRRLTAFWDR